MPLPFYLKQLEPIKGVNKHKDQQGKVPKVANL